MLSPKLRILVNEEYGYRDWIIFMTKEELLSLLEKGGTIPAIPITSETLYLLWDNGYLNGVLYTETGSEDYDNILYLENPVHLASRPRRRSSARHFSPPEVGIYCYEPPIEERTFHVRSSLDRRPPFRGCNLGGEEVNSWRLPWA